MVFYTGEFDYAGEAMTVDEDEILMQMDEFDLAGMVARSTMDIGLIINLLTAYQNHQIYKEQK